MARFGDRPAVMRVKRGGAWESIGYQQLADSVQDLSLGLIELGVRPGDRVAILSENRPEWAIADYACLTACCTDVPVYPTLPPKQIEYLLRDSGAAAIFVSSAPQLEKVRAIRAELPGLRHIIVFDADARGDEVVSLGDVMERGRAARPDRTSWRDDALRVGAGDLATIIYTSGTTGDPKGVMLTHGNITSNVVTCVSLFHFEEEEDCLSFLPLSHIFERMFGHYTMLHVGAVINYAQSIDTVQGDMLDRRPTLMASVPRLYEKIYARVLETVQSGSPLRRQIFFWAKAVGEQWADLVTAKQPVPRPLALRYRLADRLVFRKLRERTGGRVRFFISGGAPLSPEIARFFFAAGLPILEGYGLTETSPVITANTFQHHRFGTVGRPIPGTEVAIAPDGEVLTRGPSVMCGYFRKPEATAEALDREGWFHTGDVGTFDADGFLRITDRKKDLIVTAGGKNIAPQPIENLAKQNKYVSNALMLGDRRPFAVMVVVPNLDRLRHWAERRRIPGDDVEALLAHPDVHRKMEREVERGLRELAPFERPKKLLLLPRDFTVESGELTPTLKVRRRIVEERYRDAIEALYRHD